MPADIALPGLVQMAGYCVMYLMILTNRGVTFIFVTVTARITGLLLGSRLERILQIIKVSAAMEQHILSCLQITVGFILRHCIMYLWMKSMKFGRSA